MRKIILFTLVLAQVSFVFAQSLVVTGDTSFTGNLVVQIDHHLDVKNTSANPITVKCQKTNLTLPTGAESYYCFAGNCYGASDTTASNSANLAAGQQISFNNFPADVEAHSGYYDAYGVSGIAEVQYCFYDVNDTTDKTCVIITYSCSGISYDCLNGVCLDPGTGEGAYPDSNACLVACVVAVNEEISNLFEISNFFPNPTNGLTYFRFNGTKAQLKIIDILGNNVKEIWLIEGGTQILDLSDMNKGIYFGNLIVNDEVISIKKLIVK